MISFLKKHLLKIEAISKFRSIFLDTESLYLSILLYFRITKILDAIEKEHHEFAYQAAERLVNSGFSIGCYYQAKILFLFGKDHEARSKIESFLLEQPFHAEAHYLLADILYFLDEKNMAWDNLLKLLSYSTRKKTWQYLAKLVCTQNDFDKYHSILLEKYPDFLVNPSYDLLLYYSDAAYRSQNQKKVVPLWGNVCENKCLKEKKENVVRSRGYSVEMAQTALVAIKAVLDKANMPFFLISGTLLGCMREGRLLGHDKDIDIGVWDTISSEELVSIIRKSGKFYILPSTTKDLVVIRHLNGISIDIFIHYRCDNDYYHSGVKCSWHNTPFTLRKYVFMNQEYLIPDDYDLYLMENYGEWEKVKIDFDSAIDTPNMSIVDISLMKIYFYKKMYQACNSSLRGKYLKELNKLDNREIG